MTRSIVTGGTGFLGRKLCRRLREAGHEVTALGRNEERGRQLEREGISFLALDLSRDPLKGRLRCYDYVFHCAAKAAAWGRRKDFEVMNVDVTRAVVDEALAAGVTRFVHVSTPVVYFRLRDQFALEESAPLPQRPVNAYAATKKKAEALVAQAAAQGLSTVTLRPQGIIGAGDETILPRFLEAGETTGIPLFGSGAQKLDLVYVGDVAEAMLLAAEVPPVVTGRTYNVTSGEPVVYKDFVERLFARLGKTPRFKRLPFWPVVGLAAVNERIHAWFSPHREPLLTVYKAGLLGTSRTLSIDAARRDLGYRPKVAVEEAVGEFAAWWQGHNPEV